MKKVKFWLSSHRSFLVQISISKVVLRGNGEGYIMHDIYNQTKQKLHSPSFHRQVAHKSTSTSHGSHALHEQPHSTGSTTRSGDFLFWTTAQPNLGFKWCWTLIRVVWAWTSVRTSPEAEYPLAQLPDTKPGFERRSITEQGWFHPFLHQRSLMMCWDRLGFGLCWKTL